MAYDFVAGDTAAILSVSCVDATGKALNLSFQTAQLHWTNKAATHMVKTMVIADPLTGVATYQFGAGELETGKMRFEVKLQDVDTSVLTSTNIIEVLVRSHV